MAENEESEIAEGIGVLARTLSGSTLQATEASSRRNQLRDQQSAAERDWDRRQEAQLAAGLRQEVYSREFWRTASSESIADHMTVASYLAPRHSDARMASMHAADVLRNDYGINIEQMNRDHPQSLEARHHALRDALDDYFNRQRAETEADQARISSQRHAEQQEVEAVEPKSVDPADAEQDNNAESRSDETAQQKSNDNSSEVESANQSQDEADTARLSEQHNLAQAEKFGAEDRKDRENARSEESTGGRQPDPYQRVRTQELNEIGRHSPQHKEVRRRQAESFPRSTKDAIKGPVSETPKPARGSTKTQTRAQELAR